ncbi:hypothetical protein SNEBB_002129 [Seison nebaliae]|nr:hypothetical protein SNEBB_002129 [Seison nebaliae]
MRVLLENNKEAQDKYKQSFPLLQDIFKLICLSTQKVINSKKHLPYINSGHRVGIFRSLYSPDWYMISSQYIAPINDLKEFLLALQYESVDGFMFTRKDTFDDGVNKWKDILKEFRRYAVIKWTPGS